MTDELTDFERAVQTDVKPVVGEPNITRAFRELDLSDINSNMYSFPVIPDDDQTVTPQQEGEKLPRVGGDYEERTVHFDKFGFEVTSEADDDEYDEELDGLALRIASDAAREVYDELVPERTTADTRIDIVPAALRASGLTITYGEWDAVVLPAVLSEAIANNDPTREWGQIAHDLQDEYGVEVVADQYNVLGASDVLVVDKRRFGFEAIRTYPDTRSYVEYEQHDPRYEDRRVPEDEREVKAEVVQAFTRLAFEIVDSDGAYLARFGSV